MAFIPYPAPINVLLIDDDEAVGDSFAVCLEIFGYRVVAMTDPLMALERIVRSPPDVIVTDLHMPQMTGFELIEMVRQLGLTTPIIAVSGAATETLEQAQQAGAQACLAKPLSCTDLARSIERCVARTVSA